MSVEGLTWAYAQDIRQPLRKFVLVTLANYADGEGYCHPGQGKLAARTGMGESTVRKHLADLEASGFISRFRRNKPSGYRATNGYWLAIPDTCGADEVSARSGSAETPTAQIERMANDLRADSPTAQIERYEPLKSSGRQPLKSSGRPEVLRGVWADLAMAFLDFNTKGSYTKVFIRKSPGPAGLVSWLNPSAVSGETAKAQSEDTTNTGQGRRRSQGPGAARPGRGPAGARPKAKRAKPTGHMYDADQCARVLAAYNDNRNGLPFVNLTPPHIEMIGKWLRTREGLDQAVLDVADATRNCALSDLYQRRRYNLENVLRHVDANAVAWRDLAAKNRPTDQYAEGTPPAAPDGTDTDTDTTQNGAPVELDAAALRGTYGD